MCEKEVRYLAIQDRKLDYMSWRSNQKQARSATKLRCLNWKLEHCKKKSAMRINANRKAAERKWAVQRNRWV